MTKQCHFVPKVYLRNFTEGNSEYIYAYSREKCYRTNIKNECQQSYLYIVVDEASGEKDETIELQFSQLEGEVKPVLARLVDGGTGDVAQFLSMDERATLHEFAGSLISRNAIYLDKLEAFAERNNKIIQAADENQIHSYLEELGIDHDLILEEMSKHEEAPVQGSNSTKTTYLSGIKKYGEIAFHGLENVMKHSWVAEIAGSRQLITSDNPVIIARTTLAPGTYDLEDLANLVYMPISVKKAIIFSMKRPEEPDLLLANRSVWNLNSHMMNSAYNRVYSDQEIASILQGFSRTTSTTSLLPLGADVIQEKYLRQLGID